MKFTVLTLLPEITGVYYASSIMAKAVERGLIEDRVLNIRDYAQDKHKTCDDAPYGGGPGMLMLCEPLGAAFEAAGVPRRAVIDGGVASARQSGDRLVVYLSPSGALFDHETAAELAKETELVFLCGRYEGVDQRALDLYVDREISVGDYVLSSGEVATLAVIDAVYRLIEGVITPESLDEESFSGGLLEYPQWTRPLEYGKLKVPEVLLSGHHERIRKWRLRQRIEKTLKARPALIEDILLRYERGSAGGLGAAGQEIVDVIREVQNERN
jgi:tRNA (guanine37-N1)-methyltransferase